MSDSARTPLALSALDATTGNAIWSATVPDQFATQSPPVAAEGLVYTLDDGVSTPFNETNGAQVWQQGVSGTNGAPAVTVVAFTPNHGTGCGSEVKGLSASSHPTISLSVSFR